LSELAPFEDIFIVILLSERRIHLLVACINALFQEPLNPASFPLKLRLNRGQILTASRFRGRGRVYTTRKAMYGGYLRGKGLNFPVDKIKGKIILYIK
jgi:hypothetical protein